jgi:hypothetical protein
MKRTNTLFALLLMCVLLASGARGALFTYNFALNGSQETPPNASPAIGSAVVSLDTVTDLLSWNITYSGLLGNETAAHFHKAPLGIPGPVELPLVVGSPIIGSQNITPSQASDVMAGLWYVNVHSNLFPGGEIRGQVTPEPISISLLAIGGLFLRRRK